MSHVNIDTIQRDRAGTIHKKNNKMGKSRVPREIVGCASYGTNQLIAKCPAYGKACNFCKVKNHFTSVCLKKNKKNKKKIEKSKLMRLI